MNCDPKIAELLPLYINGTLKDVEKKKVEEHLKVCSKCQKDLAETKWVFDGVKEYGDVLLTGHIDSEKLVLYVQVPEQLTESNRVIIQSHLKHCSECLEEFKLLERSKKELELLEESEVTTESKTSFRAQITKWVKGVFDGLSWLVRRPAFAYVLILLLIYPAYLGLRMTLREKGVVTYEGELLSEAEGGGIVVYGVGHKDEKSRVVQIVKELTLSEQIRGKDYGIPEIDFDATKSILLLKIPYPIDTSFSIKYEVKISDSTGSTIWANSDWRKYGMKKEDRFWIFELDPINLPAGLLQIYIREQEPDQISEKPATIYQFRLRKR